MDPVWSIWEAPSNGCPARTEIEIDDDYRGDGRVVFDDCSVCQVHVDVEPKGDVEYELELDGVDCDGTVDLDCTLYDDDLECRGRHRRPLRSRTRLTRERSTARVGSANGTCAVIAVTVSTQPSLVAFAHGMSLHAATAVDGRDRKRLERVWSYFASFDHPSRRSTSLATAAPST